MDNSAVNLRKGTVVVTTAGAIIMVISVGAVLALTTFCVVRVLSLPPVEMEDLKGPLTIDTGDTENAD